MASQQDSGFFEISIKSLLKSWSGTKNFQPDLHSWKAVRRSQGRRETQKKEATCIGLRQSSDPTPPLPPSPSPTLRAPGLFNMELEPEKKELRSLQGTCNVEE
ncbi:hypothetical protein JZ751_002209 [Albula glossodonta]|uniref:Uncharacterized protein n=1 Tax=Albula glossodonta TaxID=121402 RepID=A0A8T2P7B8_9TELE|nr:hypothetical protein JZ751_002209 [Albula glossodonta]